MEKEIFVINLLEDKEFDKLPYKNISDSLGFADRETGNAFIRKTHIPVMDAANIQHEIQHLIETNNTHADEYGILHKKGRVIINTIAKIASAIPGPWQLPAMATAVGTQIRAVQKKEAPAWSIPVAAAPYAGSKFLAGFQAPGATAEVSGLGKVLVKPTFMQQVGGGLKNIVGAGGLGNVSGTSALPAAIDTGKQVAAAMGQPVTFGQTAMPSVSSAGTLSAPTQNILGSTNVGQIQKQPPQPPPPPKPFEITPTTALGGASLLGSMGLKQPEFKMPSSVEDIRQKLLQGGQLTELGLQAKGELGNILKSTPQELYAPGTDVYYQNTLKNLENEYARQKQALAQQWNAIDPNYQKNGEYILADDRLNKSYMEVRNNYVSQEEQRRFELARSQKYQAVQDALNVDKNTMDNLVGITGMSVEMAAQIYGAQVADVKQIREALGTLGTEMILRGQGMGGYQQGLGSVNINLGGR